MSALMCLNASQALVSETHCHRGYREELSQHDCQFQEGGCVCGGGGITLSLLIIMSSTDLGSLGYEAIWASQWGSNMKTILTNSEIKSSTSSEIEAVCTT